jgi:hypothetical protein
MNAATRDVAAWLGGAAVAEEGLPVRCVHWAFSPASAHNFAALATGPERPGSMLTLELEGTWAEEEEGEGEGAGRVGRDDADAAAHARAQAVLAAFYDACPIVKGPSFGTVFTLMCPFMYLVRAGRTGGRACGSGSRQWQPRRAALHPPATHSVPSHTARARARPPPAPPTSQAHYDLVASPAGRAHLYAHGLNPYLVRLSVGVEGAAVVIDALRTGLRAAAAVVALHRGQGKGSAVSG